MTTGSLWRANSASYYWSRTSYTLNPYTYIFADYGTDLYSSYDSDRLNGLTVRKAKPTGVVV